MISIENTAGSFKSFVADLQQRLKDWISRQNEAQFEAEVEAWLHRQRYARRSRVGRHQTRVQWGRCGTRQVHHFCRNGHRRRQLVTNFGVLTIWRPRVVCDCGGSVMLPFSILKPGQRFGDEMVEQIGRWAALGLSLRQMQREIGDQRHTQVGLRKLNEVGPRVRQPADLTLSRVPPGILLDAIWVTLLEPTTAHVHDKLGRLRTTKPREKVCWRVAVGRYPQTGRWGILAWTLADSESQPAWEQLLAPLEMRGLYRERGVELFVHDGGAGLVAALRLMYPHIPHQRCLFHKLRHLWPAIRPPTTLSRDEAHAVKRNLLKLAREVFYAASAHEAAQRRDAFGPQWGAEQPELAATLCRDWPESMAFFRILARFPAWQPHYLRPTSLLERVNRMLRRLFRAASAFHSASGLLAAAARVLNPYRLI